MGTNPEPSDRVTLFDTEGSPADLDANGINRTSLADALEIKTGVIWIFASELITLFGFALDPFWKLAKLGNELLGEVGCHNSSKPIFLVLPDFNFLRASCAKFSNLS